MFRVHPIQLLRATEAPHTSRGRRLKDDPMKTKHFTSIASPSTEKTIRLRLPAIEVRERSAFKKYRRNVVEIETTPDERRILDAAHLASDTLRRTFDNWVTMGRGLQLLRKKADLNRDQLSGPLATCGSQAGAHAGVAPGFATLKGAPDGEPSAAGAKKLGVSI
jgi:hypothetical protein